MAIIDKPTDHFNTVLYVGNNSTNVITGVGFQPDLVWLKDRVNANSHNLYDSVRGATKALISNATNSEITRATGLTSFDSDGFTMGSYGGHTNESSGNVGWSWKASGTAVSNTAGSITSSVSANTTAGFSVVSYTGNGTAGATVGHGLGQKPACIIVKRRSATMNWGVYHQSLASDEILQLDVTNAIYAGSGVFNATQPTALVFYLGGGTAIDNDSGSTYIAYCFAEVKGFSKAFSYTGNGSADGNFVYCGFRPAFVLIKCTSNATDWFINDNKRLGYNGGNNVLYPDLSSAEATTPQVDILSNGFKTRTVDSMINNSGYTYVGFAFAEQPFVTSTDNGSIPATAR
jgi:hypothetical protein